MDKLKALLKEHKKPALMGLFLLIVFIGGSAMSAVNVAQHRAQEAAQQHEEQQKYENSQSPANSQSDDVKLSDTQKKAIENYDEDTEKFIDTLAASVWSANNGKYTLRFSDDQYTETANGKVTKHSFAISRLERGTDTAGAEISHAVFETDTGTHMVTYMNMTGSAANGSDKISSSLSSKSMFALEDATYERTDSVADITVKGLNSEITELLGGDSKKLTAELSKWCSVHYPSVTEATWNQVASIDWKASAVTTGFTLNTDSPFELTVIYLTDSKEFSFGTQSM